MKNFSPVSDYLMGLIIIVVAFLLALASKAKRTKQELADYYHIDRKTLSKWIVYFQSEISIEEWNAKKKLNVFEYSSLTNTFGTNTSLVSNKKSLIAQTGSTYKVLGEYVKANLDKIGITLEAWEACSCFPPEISNVIIKIMNGEYEEWLAKNELAKNRMPREIYFNLPQNSQFLSATVA